MEFFWDLFMRQSHENIEKTYTLLDICFRHGFVGCGDFARNITQGKRFNNVSIVKFGSFEEDMLATLLLELADHKIKVNLAQDGYNISASKIIYKSVDSYFDITLIIDTIENDMISKNLSVIQSTQLFNYILFYRSNNNN